MFYIVLYFNVNRWQYRMLARNHTAGESLHVQSLAKIKYTCLQLITNRDRINKSTLCDGVA